MYWVRRLLVLLVAAALVVGTARLLGAFGTSAAPRAAVVSKTGAPRSPHPSSPSPTRSYGPTVGAVGVPSSSTPPTSSGGSTGTTTSASGPCQTDQVAVQPAVRHAAAGGEVWLPVSLLGTAPACTFTVSPASLAVQVSDSSGNVIWSSQECPHALGRSRTVVVSNTAPVAIRVAWSGRRSDPSCSRSTAWAMPGTYQVQAAALGSTPSQENFRLGLPQRPVVTKTAHPKKRHTQPATSPSRNPSGSPTSSPTS